MDNGLEEHKFQTKIWTSSHGTRKHFLPQSFEKLYMPNEFFAFPQIDAVPGRFLNEIFFDNYKKEFESYIQSNGRERISIIALGDNDLRLHAFRGSFHILKYTTKIVELHLGTCHPLLVFGLMPSPQTHAQTALLSEYTDHRVQTEIEKYQKKPEGKKLGFVDTTAIFSDEEGFLQHEYYYSRDGIHLSPEGAAQLAFSMIKNANILAQISLFDPAKHSRVERMEAEKDT